MLEIISLLVDFGLVVLILMVQLIVYPSFLYYEKNNLILWHRKYTVLIGFVVVPLMLIQLMIGVYQLVEVRNLDTLMSGFLIGYVWLSTFLYFAPTHMKISKGLHSKENLITLVKFNWTRTIAWTLLFLYSFYEFVIGSPIDF